MTDSRSRTQVLCNLVCKLTKTIEFLSAKSTSKYSGAMVCKLLKEVQDEVSAALGAAE